MIIYFTDDAARDADLVRRMHETRCLHQVCEVHTDADLRKALVLAITGPDQLVISGGTTWEMRKLALAIDLMGLMKMTASEYTQAGPHAAPNASVRATHDAPQPCGLPG